MATNNPFSALLEAQENSNVNDDDGVITQNRSNHTTVSLSERIEHIFGFTVSAKRSVSKSRLYLEEVSKNSVDSEMDLNILNQALFDRLFMCNSNNDYLSQYASNFPDPHVCEQRPFVYLLTSFERLKCTVQLKAEEYAAIEDIILLNVATGIMQPDIYCGQNLAEQLVEILKGNSEEFFVKSCRKVLTEDQSDVSLKIFIKSMCKVMAEEIIKSSLVTLDYNIFNCLKSFVSEEFLAEYFLDAMDPERKNIGSDYANTVLGALFNLSILPKNPNGNYEHFNEPMNVASNTQTEGVLWSNLSNINQNIHSFVLMLLKKSTKIKDKTLVWLGDCLKNNAYRGKIWNSQAPPEMNPANYTTVTDGFMINMTNELVRLCQPFTANFRENKVLKVDPTYCAVPDDKLLEKNVHIQDLNKETCLLPVISTDDVEEERPLAQSYSFVTECFFMAHKAVDLGFRVGVEKLIKMNHEMGRLERSFNEVIAGGSSDLAESLRDRMKTELSKYFSLKCQLSDPILLNIMFDLISSTSHWLCQVTLHDNFTNGNFAPINNLDVSFPLDDNIPNTLKCIPEFIVENVVSFLTFLRRFNPKVFEEQGCEKMEPIFTFILMYMGSQQRIKNPHLRARLAEALESLLPYHKDDPPGLNNLGGFQREKLFLEHPHSHEIVTSLLEVFVGIEMTGQNVEFEQKFNYRRPMYAVIKYLWKTPNQMECFERLADYAENNMEAVNPPLFLRFANLLINDAIFLLDEALSNMSKIRDMQHAQDSGEWNNLPSRERAQQMGYLHHIGMLARFDNILGKDTIGTLVKLTSKIHKVFTHSTMVDRIASMLNYFLLSLVGPTKKNFKVNDPKEFSFDPADTVIDICKIYINLKDNDAFILAISQDGRSYSPQLFTYAEDVLVRIGGGNLLTEIKEIAERVEIKAIEYKASEDALAEAPEHFLDPIMSTLMTDPVILPSSKQTVDRTTIARHLLSDQTDPFNRSPLSMDQLIPNIELAQEIKKWLAERNID